jgi:hypothetical protein
MTATQRFGFPFLAPGQAQKELFHNEALQSLDVLVAAAVEGLPQAAPPASPAVGNCYLVGASPSGDWVGKANHLAAWTSGGWRYIAPRDGLNAYVKSSGVTAAYRGGAWVIGDLSGSQVSIGGVKVIGARGAAIPAPTGGATVDAEARAAIGLILTAMRGHGLIET